MPVGFNNVDLVVTDPDGNTGLDSVFILVREVCDPDPRSQGYWHRQCLGAGLITPGRHGRGPTTVLEPDFVKELVPAVNQRLEDSIFEFLTCEDGMSAEPTSDQCEKATKQ